MGNVQMLLRQHVGAPCAPCVEVGAEVKKGTLIATPTGLGANIFSSVYGKVTEITEDRIIIEPAAEQPDEFVPVTESVEGITDESSKLDLVKAAGIVGMGGAGFPTGVKLNINLEETPMGELDPEINPELPKDFTLDCGYILVNAAECEPGLEHNTRQIEEQSDKLIRGIKYSMEITHAKKAIIAIKKKHHKAIKVLQKALENEPDIKMHLMADIYPMGEERAVVRECLGVLLTTTQLPSAARSVVINVETVCKIAEAVDEKKPCISKNMTVRGKLNGGNEAHVFFDVPVGVSVGEMIEKAGGIDGKYGEIMPEEEFLLLVQACDMFEVVRLEKAFVAAHKDAFAADPVITEDIVALLQSSSRISTEQQWEFLYVPAAEAKSVCVRSLLR